MLVQKRFKPGLIKKLAGIETELVKIIQRDILTCIPNVKFENIVGLEDAKRLLTEAVVLPKLIPEVFKGLLGTCINDNQFCNHIVSISSASTYRF